MYIVHASALGAHTDVIIYKPRTALFVAAIPSRPATPFESTSEWPARPIAGLTSTPLSTQSIARVSQQNC